MRRQHVAPPGLCSIMVVLIELMMTRAYRHHSFVIQRSPAP
jgi:hypothetical protein